MILNNYINFNENVSKPIEKGDRVVTRGTKIVWNDAGERVTIDYEGKTGIVDNIAYKTNCRIVFDNFFNNYLSDLGVLNFNRGGILDMASVEKISSNKKNERPVTLSEKVTELLSYCEYMKYDYKYYMNIDYIDISDNCENISYITKNRLDRIGDDNPFTSPLRQTMRIGRFILTLNPYTDPISLEKKVNSYKAAYNNIIGNISEFRMVKGYDIYKWYNEESYLEGTGTLNKSCMRNESDRLSLYARHPDKVSLLILVNEDEKLIGRALVWNVDEPDIIYKDRTYTIYPSDGARFEQYSTNRGWKSYEQKNMQKMKVYLNYNTGEPDENPYMDTFRYFYYSDNYLTNVIDNSDFDEDCYIYDNA